MGHVIYNISETLSDSEEALTCKLIQGKLTFVHISLWPALYRIVTDAQWISERIPRLKPVARKILETLQEIENASTDQLREILFLNDKQDRKNLSKAILELETYVLVHSRSVHTEKGKHVRVLERWEMWGSEKIKAEAGTFGFAEARSQVLKYCGTEENSLLFD